MFYKGKCGSSSNSFILRMPTPAFSLIVGAALYCSSENCIRRGTHPEAKVPLSTSEVPVPYY